MAKISFDIGSTFSGEGFNKANTAVSGLAGTAGQAAGPIRQIGTALGTLPGPAGQAAQAVTGCINAIKSFGLVGAIVAGAQVAINLAANKIKAHFDDIKDAAVKAADKMREKLDAVVQNTFGNMGRELDKLKNKMNDNVRSLENIQKAAEKVDGAVMKLAGANADATVVQLELDKLAEIAQTQGEGAKKLVEAEYNYRITLEEQKSALEQSSQEVTAARQKETYAAEKVEIAENNYKDALDALLVANEKAELAESIKETHTSEYNEVIKQQKRAAELAKDAEEKLSSARTELEVAQTEVKTAEVEAKTEETKRTIKVQESKAALEELKSEQESAARAEEKRTTINEQIAEAEKQRDEQKAELMRKEESWRSAEEQIVGELNQARVFAQQWEYEKAALEEKGFNELNELQRNGYEQYLYILKDGRKKYLDDMSEEEKKNLKDIQSVSEKQIPKSARERVQAYKEWLEHQSPNPYNIDIQRLTDQLETFPEQSKIDLQKMRENYEQMADKVKDLKEALVDAITVK